jgi:hypothetical protein
MISSLALDSHLGISANLCVHLRGHQSAISNVVREELESECGIGNSVWNYSDGGLHRSGCSVFIHSSQTSEICTAHGTCVKGGGQYTFAMHVDSSSVFCRYSRLMHSPDPFDHKDEYERERRLHLSGGCWGLIYLVRWIFKGKGR